MSLIGLHCFPEPRPCAENVLKLEQSRWPELGGVF
jgi:hypothetical protein